MRYRKLVYGYRHQVDEKGDVAETVALVGENGLRAIYRRGDNFFLEYRDQTLLVDDPDVWMAGVPVLETEEDAPTFVMYKNMMEEKWWQKK